MTDRSTVPSHESEPQASDSETSKTSAPGRLDDAVPLSWFEAERESPQDETSPIRKVRPKASIAVLPRKVNATTLFLSGLVAAIVTGTAWASAEMLGLFGTPWLAIPAGILIALIIRAGCGRDDAEGRATVASIAYLITALIVLGLLTRREVHEIYGNTADVLILEENLFRRRFRRLDQLAAYTIGWAITWFGSIWLRN